MLVEDGMIGFLSALRVQEVGKVAWVLVGIVEGIGLLILPCGYGISILLIHRFEGEVQVGSSLCLVDGLDTQVKYTILSLGQLLVTPIPIMRCHALVDILPHLPFAWA